MICGIYYIFNLVNGKFYIGSAKSVEDRIREHFVALEKNYHTNKHLQFAYNKYGGDNFEIVLLEECNKEDLLICEQQYLDKYWNSGILYNLCPTAGSTLGFKHSEHSIKKMRDSQKGNKNSTGAVRSEETRRKLREANIGKSSGNKGNVYSEKTKQRMSELKIGNKNMLGKKHTKETKAKISNANKGHKDTEKMRRNKSEAKKLWWQKRKQMEVEYER